MKSIMKLLVLSLLAFGTAACGEGSGNGNEENSNSGKGPEPIQVIVETVDAQGNYEEEKVIDENDIIEEIAAILKDVTFEEGMMGIAVMPDLRFSLFESDEQGKQEKQRSFEVWFNRDAGIGSIKDERDHFGELDKEQAERLEDLLEME